MAKAEWRSSVLILRADGGLDRSDTLIMLMFYSFRADHLTNRKLKAEDADREGKRAALRAKDKTKLT